MSSGGAAERRSAWAGPLIASGFLLFLFLLLYVSLFLHFSFLLARTDAKDQLVDRSAGADQQQVHSSAEPETFLTVRQNIFGRLHLPRSRPFKRRSATRDAALPGDLLMDDTST